MSDAREQAIKAMAIAISPVGRIDNPDGLYRRQVAEAALDALLAATQDNGSPLVLLAPEQIGWEALDGTLCTYKPGEAPYLDEERVFRARRESQ